MGNKNVKKWAGTHSPTASNIYRYSKGDRKITAEGVIDPAGVTEGNRDMFKKPKPPEATSSEKALERRQIEALASLDDEENTRMKRGLRGRLGTRGLLAGRMRSRVGGSAGSSGGSSGGGGGTYLGGGSSGGSRSSGRTLLHQ
jgi:hypothetical protein